MFGDVVEAPDGTKVTLVDVGTTRIFENDCVRIWDVALEPGGQHPWHLHHNPYVVLSVRGSSGRMDWLDGAEPRHITEYTGGAVFRPVSPIHRLTNTGGTHYRNRLVELKDLGEKRPGGVSAEVGNGARSVEGQSPEGMAGPGDGRESVLGTDFVRVWTIVVPAGATARLDLDPVDHVLAELDGALENEDLENSITYHGGGPYELANPTERERTFFVVSLDYLTEEAVR